MATKRVTAAEAIAEHLGWDINEMKDCRYQPTHYPVAIYTVGNDYYCAPAIGKEPPKDFRWAHVGNHRQTQRKIYRSTV